MGGGATGVAGTTRIRTSTIAAPLALTITGLQSISAISGCASAIAPTRTSTSSSASTSVSGAPRYPVRRGNVRSSRSIARTSPREIGVSRTATSRISSASIPPAPHTSIGPNCGSPTTPTSIRTPGGTISCTSSRAPSSPSAFARASSRAPAAMIPASESRSSAIDVRSPRSGGSPATAFSATGTPTRSAACTASSGESTTSPRATGSPYAVQIRSASAGVSQPPPSASARAMTAAAASVSAWTVAGGSTGRSRHSA